MKQIILCSLTKTLLIKEHEGLTVQRKLLRLIKLQLT